MNASEQQILMHTITAIDNNTQEYMKLRSDNYSSWFGPSKLLPNADENGTIMDFAIVGFAKCGTTTMEANLGYIAPMPIGDICTPVSQTVYYSYKSWPKEHGEEKLFRGTKCPAFIQGNWLDEWSKHLPRTKLIIGIRHPVAWFKSFWDMQANRGNVPLGGPYELTTPCFGKSCRNGCPGRQLFCLHRGRFHLALAKLGKTALTGEERKMLAPNDADGGENLRSSGIKNPIFLYDQQELSQDYVWEELAEYLGVNHIPHDKYQSSHPKRHDRNLDFCEEKYDDFRAMMMPYAYELSVWLQEYLIPVANDDGRDDVVIPRADSSFSKRVEDYKNDPCGKLIRSDNGTYVRSGVTAVAISAGEAAAADEAVAGA